MPEPPRRVRFQIHLSTAIVLMFTSGKIGDRPEWRILKHFAHVYFGRSPFVWPD